MSFWSWDPVPGPAVTAKWLLYQVLVGSFQVTQPASSRSVSVPPEFVRSLESGEQPFEVLAIETGGNQSLTVGVFQKP